MNNCPKPSTATIYAAKSITAATNCIDSDKSNNFYGLPVKTKARQVIAAEVLTVTVDQNLRSDSTAMGGSSYERVALLRVAEKLEVGWKVEISEGAAWSAFGGKIADVIKIGMITRIVIH